MNPKLMTKEIDISVSPRTKISNMKYLFLLSIIICAISCKKTENQPLHSIIGTYWDTTGVAIVSRIIINDESYAEIHLQPYCPCTVEPHYLSLAAIHTGDVITSDQFINDTTYYHVKLWPRGKTSYSLSIQYSKDAVTWSFAGHK